MPACLDPGMPYGRNTEKACRSCYNSGIESGTEAGIEYVTVYISELSEERGQERELQGRMRVKQTVRGLLALMSLCALLCSCGSAKEGAPAPQNTESLQETEAPQDSETLQNTEIQLETESQQDTSEQQDRSEQQDAAAMQDAATQQDSTAQQDASTNKQGTSEQQETESPQETEENGMSATLLYQGHASVRIVTAEGKVIYIDPFMGEGYDLPADLILMTHGHYDHTQDNLIASKNADCQKITWVEALQGGTHQSFDEGYVKIEAVEAGYNKNHSTSECVGFILTFTDGVKVYLSGDTSTTPSMPELAAKDLDYAFLCCDGVYNMDVAEASECAKVINARHTIPYHMIPANESGFDMGVAESFDGPGKIILQPGEELALE